MFLIHYENWDGATVPTVPSGWTTNDSIVTTSAVVTPISSPNMVLLARIVGGPGAITWGTADSNSGNIYVQATGQFQGGPSPGGYVSALGRCNSSAFEYASSTGYEAQFLASGATGTVYLNKIKSGSLTTLASASIPAVSFGDWYQIGLTLNGSSTTNGQIAVQRLSDNNWLTSGGAWQSGAATCVNYNDSSSPITGAGYAGWGANPTNSSVYGDDWYFYELSAPPAVTAVPYPSRPKSRPLTIRQQQQFS